MKNKDIIVDCTTYNYENLKNNYIDDQLILTIEDIDDLAIAWIVSEQLNFYNANNENSYIFDENITKKHPKWLWRSGGNHGSGTVNLTQWFHNNYKLLFNNSFNGYLVIAIYDFEYKSFLLPGGKWSFDAKLILNGNIIWNNHMFQSSTKNIGLKYVKIFSLKINNKKIKISETIKIQDKDKIIEKLIKNFNYYKIENNKLIRK